MPVREYKRGDSFGDLGLCCSCTHSITVRCREAGALWVLRRAPFHYALLSTTQRRADSACRALRRVGALEILSDGDVGPADGWVSADSAKVGLCFLEEPGSRVITIDVAPKSTLTAVRYFSSGNDTIQPRPPKYLKVTLLPMGKVVAETNSLKEAWNEFAFPVEAGVDQVQIELTKEGKYTCVSEIEIEYDGCDSD